MSLCSTVSLCLPVFIQFKQKKIIFSYVVKTLAFYQVYQDFSLYVHVYKRNLSEKKAKMNELNRDGNDTIYASSVVMCILNGWHLGAALLLY